MKLTSQFMRKFYQLMAVVLLVLGALFPTVVTYAQEISNEDSTTTPIVGVSFRPGAFDAVGDRLPVPLRAACPWPEENAPGGSGSCAGHWRHCRLQRGPSG